MKHKFTGKEAENIGRFGLVQPGQVLDFTANETAHVAMHGHDKLEPISAQDAAAAEKEFAEKQMKAGKGKVGSTKSSPQNKEATPPDQK